MLSVSEMADEIVSREGGYVNDPDDPGGATNFGVTIHTMRRLGLDLNGDGRITPADVKKLSKQDALDIFINDYFNRPKIDLLPKDLHDTVFDMYVNAGGNAIKILQRITAEFGFAVAVDGALGPMTAKAVIKAHEASNGSLRDAYGIGRRNYYFGIADRRPQSRKYCVTLAGGKGGWIKRAEEFISPKYHLTEKEFKERISRWA